MEVVVLNCWVMATKETFFASKISTSLAKSVSERVSHCKRASFGGRTVGVHVKFLDNNQIECRLQLMFVN